MDFPLNIALSIRIYAYFLLIRYSLFSSKMDFESLKFVERYDFNFFFPVLISNLLYCDRI